MFQSGNSFVPDWRSAVAKLDVATAWPLGQLKIHRVWLPKPLGSAIQQLSVLHLTGAKTWSLYMRYCGMKGAIFSAAERKRRDSFHSIGCWRAQHVQESDSSPCFKQMWRIRPWAPQDSYLSSAAPSETTSVHDPKEKRRNIGSFEDATLTASILHWKLYIVGAEAFKKLVLSLCHWVASLIKTQNSKAPLAVDGLR